jgi:prefoldin subunit 5
MIQIPDNFPSYTSYSPKTLIMQVDTLKAALRELQQEIAALKAMPAPVKTKTEKTDKV